MVLPAVVVTDEDLGENEAAFSGISVNCLGIIDARGRRSCFDVFAFKPPPTSVHPGYGHGIQLIYNIALLNLFSPGNNDTKDSFFFKKKGRKK